MIQGENMRVRREVLLKGRENGDPFTQQIGLMPSQVPDPVLDAGKHSKKMPSIPAPPIFH